MSTSDTSNVPYEYDTWAPGYHDIFWLYIIGLGSFIVILFIIFMFARHVGEEPLRIHYSMKWGRFIIALLVASQFLLLYIYWYSEEPLIPPYYGIARPFVGLIPCLFGVFSDSHPMFRWIFGGGHALYIFADTYSAFKSNQWLSCDGNECNPMYTRDNMELLRYRDYAAIILDIHAILIAGILFVFQGFFSQRYHFITAKYD
jgi:hypothetical protein